MDDVQALRDRVAELEAELADVLLQIEYHKAFRPEVVAEVAVELTEEADWDEVATWCGGGIQTFQDPSGEYTSYIIIPGSRTESGRAEWVPQGMWITLDHDGKFRVRHTIGQPGSAI